MTINLKALFFCGVGGMLTGLSGVTAGMAFWQIVALHAGIVCFAWPWQDE